MKRLITIAAMVLLPLLGMSQVTPTVYMTAANNGTTQPMQDDGDGGMGLIVRTENDSTNQYLDGPYDRWMAITGSCVDPTILSITFESFDIDPRDTLFIYDGVGLPPNSTAKMTANNNHNPLGGISVYVDPLNTTSTLTLRLKTNGDGSTGSGFVATVRCKTACERITPVIDSMYLKTRYDAREGRYVVYDTGYTRIVPRIDTNWITVQERYEVDAEYDTVISYDSIGSVVVYDTNGIDTLRIDIIYDTANPIYTVNVTYDTTWITDTTGFDTDTNYFRGVHLCKGDGVEFLGHGEYTNYYGYGASDNLSIFSWTFGNGETLEDIAATHVSTRYRDLDCYDVTLRITDHQGCMSTLLESVVVRLAQNPVKTIYDLANMCNSDSNVVNIGYSGDNSTITLTLIEFAQTKSRTINCKTFIPDGKNKHCLEADDNECFRAPINFDDFPSGRQVNSAADICSVCINMEHSFNGDFRMSLICPSEKVAVLKYGNPDLDVHDTLTLAADGKTKVPTPEGSWGSLGTYIGVPYGAPNDGSYDTKCTGDQGYSQPPADPNYCDSVCNMYGVGWDYCFSRNGDFTLNSGKPCNTTEDEPSDYFCTSDWVDHIVDFAFQTIPAPYAQAGTTAPNGDFNSKHPSNHDEKLDYYLPSSYFGDLIGCPLNGEWSIQVCDRWGLDNGWVFSWSLDICGISQGNGCNYQVGIDSVVWTPDSSYGDFQLGHWRGVTIDALDSVRSSIKTPDTAGSFPIFVKIYDEFGCEWDTMTNLTSIWVPQPELGPDITLCDIQTVRLDASDRHTRSTNQEFSWEPYGDSTAQIETRALVGRNQVYIVEVKNEQEGVRCRTQDSIHVNIYPQPTPNFDPGVYPMEGCEPFTIHFENTSLHGDHYLWDFGDGETSTAKSPTHTFGTGQYDLKYYITSDDGCGDSLIYHDLITVYSSPVAKFSWEPMNPTVLHPQVTFQNHTIPQSDDNKYYWEVQYDRDNKISYHTLTDVNPTFEWYTDGEDISGSYVARLIAKTENRGPSGYIVECRDTVENTILLVNDYLEFPTAVTPNGDGINDRFEIINLINGLGYPNNSLAIYDRWGKRVYYKENITSEEDFWDPSNVPAGTYFWRFVGKGYLGDIQRNGSVEVIK